MIRPMLLAGVLLFSAISTVAASEPRQQLLDAIGPQRGLVVHLGCGDGQLTAALATEGRLVQGFDAEAANVDTARQHVRQQGLYGRVCIDQQRGPRLPLIDNLANVVVAEDLGEVSMDEILRVLCPGGVACVKQHGRWTRSVKPRPAEIDDWTHYLYDASNNAVSRDTVVGPPRRLQWVGGPRYARHHDRMSSFSAVVSAGGRVFYIFDEADCASILAPPQWTLIARDAFNGTLLWKRSIDRWHTHLWPLKSGPAQLPRRLVAGDDCVYVTLSLDGPLVALDAATGDTRRTFDTTRATEEVILSDGVLFAVVNPSAEKPPYASLERVGRAYAQKFWDEKPRRLMAIRAQSGDVLWTAEHTALPTTLAADARRVVFHDGRGVVCLDRQTGKEAWRSEPIDRAAEIRSFYSPTLVLHDDVVLFSGGETAGLQTGSWYTSGKDTLTALAADTGKVLWTSYHPPSGYRSAEDLLVAGGLVWTGETTSGRAVGVFTGRDPKTGEVKSEFPPDVDTYWFHHRCHRGKATENFLLMSRAGIEFIDFRQQRWTPHHWVRGACLYGVMPANGLIYAPQHPCACYLEAKLFGFNALAPASEGPRVSPQLSAEPRLVKGPAWQPIDAATAAAATAAAATAAASAAIASAAAASAAGDDWPTYRHDAARSGRATTTVAAPVGPQWQTTLGGRLSSPVVADGAVFVAALDTHAVHAIDASTGAARWQFTAGGAVDSPPTIYQGRVLFGAADGWVYCLRAADGALAWRFRAAPTDQRTVYFDRLESVWPVHGSVLVRDGAVWCVAGRSMFLDGGLTLWRLDAISGEPLSQTVLDERDAAADKELQAYVSWLNMPVGLPDVLSSDGRRVFMRSQPFMLDGTRAPLKAMPAGTDADAGAPPPTQDADLAHLFSPTGFLDDTWWHRTYWLYGSTFAAGWCGYYRSGTAAPAGRILVVGDEKVYGFGRKPQYYRWTTPIEHHLFAAEKAVWTGEPAGGPSPGPTGKPSRVRVEKSASLNPAGKPITVEAWVKADQPNGVVLARGGNIQGYALYVQGGKPVFALRTDEQLRTAVGPERIVGRWTHLAGVLSGDKQLRLFVDGKLAGSAQAASPLNKDPQDGLDIGGDDNSAVGDYSSPLPLTGAVDEVRLYHRALSAEEVAQHAAAERIDDKQDLVLALAFEKGKAQDASGNANHGKVEGAVRTAGKVGDALAFSGRAQAGPQFHVKHAWTQDLPLLARAMVLAGDTLFVAGPPDLVDEEQAMKQIDEPEVQQQLAEQADAFRGNRGGLLWAVSAASGERIAELKLDTIPVFDGMAAASGRLFLTTADGRVLCLGPKP